jgi:hypothetical protein
MKNGKSNIINRGAIVLNSFNGFVDCSAARDSKENSAIA